MLDEIPEEDRMLRQEQFIKQNEAAIGGAVAGVKSSLAEHKHEWVDMYAGGGYKRGDQTIGLQAFYCKWCLEIQVKQFNQSQYNLRSIEDEGDFRDDG